MIHIYHGNGKGKTTAAIGLSIRAAGAGMKVLFCQFMKGSRSSELEVLEQLKGVQVMHLEKAYPFYKDMTYYDKEDITEEHVQMLQNVKAVLDLGFPEGKLLVVLDELCSAYRYSLVDGLLVEDILTNYPGVEIVITGREPADDLLEKADYITNMEAEKHPFEKGVKARKGIEF